MDGKLQTGGGIMDLRIVLTAAFLGMRACANPGPESTETHRLHPFAPALVARRLTVG